MKSTLLSRRDLDFLLYEWLRVDELTKRPRYAEHSRETFDDVLDLGEQLATGHFAPHNKTRDAQEPTLRRHRVTVIPRSRRPSTRSPRRACSARAADEASAVRSCPRRGAGRLRLVPGRQRRHLGYPMLTIGNANLLPAHGSREQIDTYVRPMLEGRFFGTMACPSRRRAPRWPTSLTRAEPQADGTYRLFGTKMWISGGEHELAENIVHLVLAKIPGGPPGTKGISLFIVPKFLVEAGRVARRTQRRGAGRAEPQDGLPRHHQHPAQLRRRRPPPAARRAPSATWSASRTRAWRRCST